MDVRVANPHAVAQLGQPHCQIRRHGTLAHPSLSAGHCDHGTHAGQDLAGLGGAFLSRQRSNLHLHLVSGRSTQRPLYGKQHRLLHSVAGVHGRVRRFDHDSGATVLIRCLLPGNEAQGYDVLPQLRVHHPTQGLPNRFLTDHVVFVP